MEKSMPRRMVEDWCRADTLQSLELICEEKGLDWPRIARRFGIAPETVHQTGATVPYRIALSVCEFVAAETRDDAIILDVASSMPTGVFSTFDYVGLCAPNLRAGIRNWVRFLPLRSNSYGLSFREDEDWGIIEWIVPDRNMPRTQHTFERIAWAASRVEYATQDPQVQLRIDISQPAPRCRSAFQERYGSRLRFGQPADRILIPAKYLDRPTPNSEQNLYSIVEQAAIREMEEFRVQSDPLVRVADAINESLKAGAVSLEHVASELGMSQRSLQRLLEAEGTSFRKLTETIRRNMAARYLRDTSLPLKEIAFLLGFSELSAFSRAVKTWYGVPPKAVRLHGETPAPLSWQAAD